jgi:hypothetical protein
LKRLGLEKLPNLRTISIYSCRELREIEVGSGGFPMLESLYLQGCPNLESIVGPHDVWNEKTMPKLQLLQIVMPIGEEIAERNRETLQVASNYWRGRVVAKINLGR